MFLSIGGPMPKCTYTLAWIYKQIAFYLQYPDSYIFKSKVENIRNICSSYDYTQFQMIYNACNISERMQKCDIIAVHETLLNYQDSYFQIYDLQNGIKEAKTVMLTDLGPWVCFFAFFTNLMVALTILNGQRKKSTTNKNIQVLLATLKQPFSCL